MLRGAVVVTCALLVSGFACSSSSREGASGNSTRPSTTIKRDNASYIEAANALCRHFVDWLAVLPDVGTDRIQLARKYDTVANTEAVMAGQLRAIPSQPSSPAADRLVDLLMKIAVEHGTRSGALTFDTDSPTAEEFRQKLSALVGDANENAADLALTDCQLSADLLIFEPTLMPS
jgi:hypothetical protein